MNFHNLLNLIKSKVIGLLGFIFLLIHKELEFVHGKDAKSSLLAFLSFNAEKMCRKVFIGF